MGELGEPHQSAVASNRSGTHVSLRCQARRLWPSCVPATAVLAVIHTRDIWNLPAGRPLVDLDATHVAQQEAAPGGPADRPFAPPGVVDRSALRRSARRTRADRDARGPRTTARQPRQGIDPVAYSSPSLPSTTRAAIGSSRSPTCRTAPSPPTCGSLPRGPRGSGRRSPRVPRSRTCGQDRIARRAAQLRRAAKNSRRRAALSAARTPSVTAARWLSRGSSSRR